MFPLYGLSQAYLTSMIGHNLRLTLRRAINDVRTHYRDSEVQVCNNVSIHVYDKASLAETCDKCRPWPSFIWAKWGTRKISIPNQV